MTCAGCPQATSAGTIHTTTGCTVPWLPVWEDTQPPTSRGSELPMASLTLWGLPLHGQWQTLFKRSPRPGLQEKFVLWVQLPWSWSLALGLTPAHASR